MTLRQPANQMRLRKVSVKLPRAFSARGTTVARACYETTFVPTPEKCGAPSRVGTAEAVTPTLPTPLTGRARLVGHNARLPTLEVGPQRLERRHRPVVADHVRPELLVDVRQPAGRPGLAVHRPAARRARTRRSGSPVTSAAAGSRCRRSSPVRTGGCASRPSGCGSRTARCPCAARGSCAADGRGSRSASRPPGGSRCGGNGLRRVTRTLQAARATPTSPSADPRGRAACRRPGRSAARRGSTRRRASCRGARRPPRPPKGVTTVSRDVQRITLR